MNQQFTKYAFEQADKLFKDFLVPWNFQALANQGVTSSKEFYERTAAATQDGARALTQIADIAWSCTKILNDKLAQNLAGNVEATFTAAHAIATAKSLPEMARLQRDFIHKLTAQAMGQVMGLVDLSTGASQHVLEKMQTATASPSKRAA